MLQTSSFDAIAHSTSIHSIDMNISNSMENMAAIQTNFHREALNLKILDGTNLIVEKPEGRQTNREKIDLVNPPEFAGSVLSVYLIIAAGALIIFQLLCKREQIYTATDFR
ncbi:hypothetical protein [Gloeocapsopsis dulcis]|uniref:Uncharacterized protein n=1 Tax=Gloeocapsopsis dulcis AAB1 = 1H9 TaxID=1433147 RepID=A0A6N8G2G3_9CHRO|nr:hypothetical protein [Gloeocapsopsis dulcis]MUL39523.1 hypothetical protein [Gloeocapsopsis dulcis AAB1 = 1H9]WNN89445.1 hypothetical protein P0S91_24965 [Gloeocapsopsis dulcis]